MHIQVVVILCILVLASACRETKSQRNTWPYSDAYRGLTPLSAEQAKEQAIHECQRRLGTTNDEVISVLPVQELRDYFRVVVRGTLHGMTLTNAVLIHRFTPKGDKIETTPKEPEGTNAASTGSNHHFQCHRNLSGRQPPQEN